MLLFHGRELNVQKIISQCNYLLAIAIILLKWKRREIPSVSG